LLLGSANFLIAGALLSSRADSRAFVASDDRQVWVEIARACRLTTMTGIGAPTNTPAEIVAWLNEEINAGHVDPRMKARLPSLVTQCLQVRLATSAS
jgi:hypothetical protein